MESLCDLGLPSSYHTQSVTVAIFPLVYLRQFIVTKSLLDVHTA